MTDSRDDQDKLEYIKKDLLQPLVDRRPLSTPTARQLDDDSNHLFMSEPSMSEADSSEHLLRLLSPAGSLTEDDMDVLSPRGGTEDYLVMPPPLPPARILNATQSTHSPGNTSLSSWESPHITRQVQVHFSPDAQEHPKGHSNGTENGHDRHLFMPSHPWGDTPCIANLRNRSNFPPESGVGVRAEDVETPDGVSDYPRSSASTSSASEGQRRRLEDFLEDLRVTSKGRVQESLGGAHTSFESSFVPPEDQPEPDLNGVLRQTGADRTTDCPRHVRVSSVDTALVENKSGHSTTVPVMEINNPPADDTVIMTLSASDDEGTKETTTTGEDAHPLDWEQQHSADDELTAPRRMRSKQAPHHRRKPSGDSNGGHRRQRSGDAAAATLLTGSTDWKGMEQDNIPLPPVPSEQDDEDEDEHEDKQDHKTAACHRDSVQGIMSGIDGCVPSYRNIATTPAGSMAMAQFSNFALGSGGSGVTPSYVNRQARRLRRDSRGRQKRESFERNLGSSDAGGNTPEGDPHDPLPSSSISAVRPPLSPTRRHSLPQPATTSDVSDSVQGSNGTQGSGAPDQSERPWRRTSTPSPQPDFQNMSPIWSHRDMNGMLPGYRRSLVPPSLHASSPPFSPRLVQPLQNYSNSHERWGHSSWSSGESSFSWLSGRQLHCSEPQEAELSPYWVSPHQKHATLTHSPSWASPKPPDDQNLVEEQEDLKTDGIDESSSSSGSEDHVRLKELRSGQLQTPSTVMRPRHSPFANIGKSVEKADRRRFLPQTSALMDGDAEKKFATYICPRCKTRQREFFTVSDAPRQFESTSGYVALYFAIYVIAALYIFGLQEGWPALDCIYFAVTTLTTTGLGDFVPTSDGSKILCSIFIYFGVACIGLLLGSYVAGMLDESSSREAKANRIDSCPNCCRLKTLKDAQERQQMTQKVRRGNSAELPKGGPRVTWGRGISFSERSTDDVLSDERQPTKKRFKSGHRTNDISSQRLHQSCRSLDTDKKSGNEESATSPKLHSVVGVPLGTASQENGLGCSPRTPTIEQKKPNQNLLGSPMTAQILGRQSHTRHSSFDMSSHQLSSAFQPDQPRGRNFSADLPTTLEEGGETNESDPDAPPGRQWTPDTTSSDVETDDDTTESDDSESWVDSEEEDVATGDKVSRVKNAKYVFLTLKEALVNSMVIIAFGCLGFYFIEGFSIVDSWYFTTVLLTTVGFGDITPVTRGGKLFATVYLLVAGTILLNNMSLISMIPLELRKRRIEQAVLTQFGDQLDDAALRELATGPLIQRLHLSAQRPGGLDECTREMFALAMLVRLGKVTEQDLRSTFAAFHRLDVNKEGVLNSKSIIAGMIHKRRSTIRPMAHQQQPVYPSAQPNPSYWQPRPPSNSFMIPNNNLYYGGRSDLPPSYHYSPVRPQVNNDRLSPPNEHTFLAHGSTPYGSYDMASSF